MREAFRKFARVVSDQLGRSSAFFAALLIVAVWAASGPLFGFSDTWQLVINTGTTIVTFLMVFLIQNTQNRDARAIHLKLDELLRAIRLARTELCDLEEMSDEELAKLKEEFTELSHHCAKHAARADELLTDSGEIRAPSPRHRVHRAHTNHSATNSARSQNHEEHA